MNGKTKTILVSLVVIALALTAVSGVTYSWFTDEDSQDVTVTTGVVDIQKGVITPINKGEGYMQTVVDPNGNVSIENLMTGTCGMKIPVTNNSTVPIQYRVYVTYSFDAPVSNEAEISISMNGGNTVKLSDASYDDALLDDLVEGQKNFVLKDWTKVAEAKGTIDDITISVIGSDKYVSPSEPESFSLKIGIQAIQGNYVAPIVSNNTVDDKGFSQIVTADKNVVGGTPVVEQGVIETSAIKNVTVQLDSQNTQVVNNKVSMKQVAAPGDSNFKVGDSEFLLDLKIVDENGVAQTADDIGATTVTVTVPGLIVDPKVIYTGAGAQPTDVTYEYVAGNTVVTFTTTHFSQFLVTENKYAENDTGSAVVFDNDGLQAAVADKKNVVLGADLNGVKDIAFNGDIDITMDLNGHNIILLADNQLIVDGAKLDLVGTGSITYTKNAHFYPALRVVGSTSDVADYSVVTIGKNVTIHSDGSYGAAINGPADDKSKAFGAKVIVNGTIDSTYGFSVSGNVTSVGTNTPEIIVNGEIKGSAGIYAAGYAKYIINGKLTGEEFGIEIRAGELVVNEGANIIATGAFTNPVPNGNGSTVEGAAIAVSQHTTNCPIAVTINGGNIIASGANGYALFEIDTVENESADMVAKNVVINVNGGTFTGGVMSINDKIVLPAGNLLFFDKASYVLGDASQAAAAIGVIGYETLNGAVVAASEGQTVTLLKDLTLEKTTVVDKDIAFDLNGKSLKLENETVADFKAIAGTSVVDFNIRAGTGGLTFSPVGDVVKVAGDINTGTREIQHHMIKLLGDADIEFDCYQENSYSITMATYGDNSISGSLMDKDGVLRGKAMMLFIVSHGTKLDLSCALKYSDVKIYTSNDLTITGNCSNSFSFDAYENHPYVLGTFWFVNTANLTISDLTVTDGMVILTGNCNVPSGQSLNILEKARLICGYKSNYYGIGDGVPVIKTGELTVAGTLKVDSKPVAMPQYQTPTDPAKKICLGDSPIVVWGSGDPDKPDCPDSTIKVVSGGEVFNTGTVNNKGVFSIEDGGSYNNNAGPIELAKGVAFGPALQ